MPNLNQAQPPAWAISLGTSLNEMYLNNQILQDVLKLAADNVQEEGKAANAAGERAYDAQWNQGESTRLEGISFISNGVTNLGSQLGIEGITFGVYKNPINGTTESLKNPTEWDKYIDEVEAGVHGEHNMLAGGNQAQNPNRSLDSLKKQNGSKDLDDDMKEDILSAKGNHEVFSELKKNVSNRKSNLHESLRKTESDRDQIRSRLLGYANNAGTSAQGTSKMYEAQNQQAGAQIQMAKAMADFFSETTRSVQQTIMGLKDQMYNLMVQGGDSLIGKLAESNKV
ncbi:MAG: hypothetical protein V4487_02665 [Chlamydiota bacterium]